MVCTSLAWDHRDDVCDAQEREREEEEARALDHVLSVNVFTGEREGAAEGGKEGEGDADGCEIDVVSGRVR